jgi:glycosyltransferase involved in cell wall biosynthesis
MVSINCITYNHEEYIADAIESFLMQKTDFEFEILIHDDASTDRTPDIIRSFEKKYPGIINTIYQTENKYSQKIDVDELNTERAKGKYIAICEGDDYWIDPFKLQKQVDYMETHPECSMCFHAAYAVNIKKKIQSPIRPDIRDRDFSVEEIIWGGGPFIATNSIIYPTVLDKDKPFFYKNAPTGDYPLVIYLALEGTAHYLDDFMSAYRRGVSGSWSVTEMDEIEKMENHYIEIEKMLEEVNRYTEYRYDSTIKDKIDRNLFNVMIVQGRFDELKAGKYQRIYEELSMMGKTKIFMREHFPGVVHQLKRLEQWHKLRSLK